MQTYHRWARLGRADDILPWGGRLFGKGSDAEGYEIVDPRDTHTAALVMDGSIVLEDPPAAALPEPPAAVPSAPAPSDDH
jgi:hypothetical protein